jgi:hypothetical protein
VMMSVPASIDHVESFWLASGPPAQPVGASPSAAGLWPGLARGLPSRENLTRDGLL